MKKGSGTRSGLLWEVERLLNECTELPDILLMENVPQVHSEQNKNDFDDWLAFLRSKGYHNFYKDLNAKNFGVPQNRERCFCVSILSNDFVDYEFPNEIKLNFKMKDFLEPVVDEKYYINSPKAKELIEKLVMENKLPNETSLCSTERTDSNGKFLSTKDFSVKPVEICPTVCARYYKGPEAQGSPTVLEKHVGMNGVVECQK